MNLAGSVAQSHQKVVQADVLVNESLRVNVLDACDLRVQNTDRQPERKVEESRGEVDYPVDAHKGIPLTSCSPSIKTVFRLNFRLQRLNRSSREGAQEVDHLQIVVALHAIPSDGPYSRCTDNTRICHAPSRSPRPHQGCLTEKDRDVHQFEEKRTATHFLLAESCEPWTRPAAAGASFCRLL